ncbi:MAG: SIMPL domain-containing protein [Terrimesophilobacter sp.]
MTETIITVQGQHTAYFPAERATLHFSVNHDGSQRSAVFARATSAGDLLRGKIVALHNESTGPITWWASDSVRVWSDRPWNNEGKQLPLVYHAVIGFTAKFNEFDELARFIEDVADVDGVTISQLEWALTDSRTRDVTAEVQSSAVQDAVSKATVYAKAIGLSSVTAVAVADPGMLSDGGRGGAEFGMERTSFAMKAMDVGGAAELSLRPNDIEVSASVDVRFVAT